MLNTKKLPDIFILTCKTKSLPFSQLLPSIKSINTFSLSEDHYIQAHGFLLVFYRIKPSDGVWILQGIPALMPKMCFCCYLIRIRKRYTLKNHHPLTSRTAASKWWQSMLHEWCNSLFAILGKLPCTDEFYINHMLWNYNCTFLVKCCTNNISIIQTIWRDPGMWYEVDLLV